MVDRGGDGETALLIGHGGWIEPTVTALLGIDRVQDWDISFGHLEGVRLAERAGRFDLAASSDSPMGEIAGRGGGP